MCETQKAMFINYFISARRVLSRFDTHVNQVILEVANFKIKLKKHATATNTWKVMHFSIDFPEAQRVDLSIFQLKFRIHFRSD